MQLSKQIHQLAEIYFPEHDKGQKDLKHTSHLGIGAHQDDLEIFAIHGILAGIEKPANNFAGVTVTDGRGAPRNGPYADMDDATLWQIRMREQRMAADLGRYLAQIQLNYRSSEVKSTNRRAVISDLKNIIQQTQPEIIYTHNLADKHDTHVAVALATIQALRELPLMASDIRVLGCEVWRSLDWLLKEDKVVLDVSEHQNLQKKLLSVYASQIAGGKAYDDAALGRRLANATFFQSHTTDQANSLVFAMDLTALVREPESDILTFVTHRIRSFEKDVRERLERLGRKTE